MEEKLLLEISERMGEAVHNAWMKKRKKEKGWHNPKDCPNHPKGSKDFMKTENGVYLYCSNCHSCMRPYSELPESEKELDRKYPKLFFKILDDMAYTFVKITKK